MDAAVANQPSKRDSIKRALKRFFSVVKFQLSDKLDFSKLKQRKTRIQTIVFGILKFVAVAGIIYLLLNLLIGVKILRASEVINIYILFFTLLYVLTLISNIFTVTKTLYYADDNKLLVTLPTGSSSLFFSKLIVFFIFDLKKSLDLLIPLTLGFVLTAFLSGEIQLVVLFWCWIPLLFSIAIMALLAALFSIIALQLKKLFRNVPILEVILLTIIVGAAIFGIVKLIGLIPQDIDLINQWPAFQNKIHDFLNKFNTYAYPFTYVVRSMTGELGNYLGVRILGQTFIRFAIIIGVTAVLIVLDYLIIRPFYFTMMTKTNEFDKNTKSTKKNREHQKYITFINKEFKLTFRDMEISGSYLVVYIAVPILLLLIDTIFGAINTKLSGNIMAYAFNILLILVPYLASNSIIATLYSKEGRSAYIKKTKPINPLFPLGSKMIFNLVFSIPSMICSIIVFSNFAHFSVMNAILIGLGLLFMHYAHIIYSATLDILNPQNEQYATAGDEFSNPNERKSTLVAFIGSAAIALISYFLFTESMYNTSSFNGAIIKLFIIGLLLFGSAILLYILKIKAFYYDKEV